MKLRSGKIIESISLETKKAKKVNKVIEKVECEYCGETFDKNIFNDHECPNDYWCGGCNKFHANEHEDEEIECDLCSETFNDNETYVNHYCPDGEYCSGCNSFHRKELPEPKVLNDNSELKIKDTEACEMDMRCVVCLGNKPSVLFLPCSHLACCNECNSKIEEKCPVCRSDITECKQVILC